MNSGSLCLVALVSSGFSSLLLVIYKAFSLQLCMRQMLCQHSLHKDPEAMKHGTPVLLWTFRTEKVARNAMLRTKAMRERDEQRDMKKYNYSVLRIRLPDGYIMQDIFYAPERVSNLFNFVREQLQNDWLPYELLAPGGHKLEDEQSTLIECGLVPAAY